MIANSKLDNSRAANHQANRYRQSPSPARQRGSTSLLSYGRGQPKRSNILSPFRTQQAALLHKSGAGSASMQNIMPQPYVPPRRSSAAGLVHNASVANGYRSHSVDGLLDQAAAEAEAAGSSSQDSLSTPEQRIAKAAAMVAAGSTALTNASSTCTLQPEEESPAEEEVCPVTRREKQSLAPPNVQQHRKSRSLDHILSKQTLAELLPPSSEPTDETQSMQNLALPPTPQPQRRDTSSSSKSPTPERPMQRTVANRQSPDGVSSTESEREDAQSLRSQAGQHGNQQRASAHVHRGGSQNSNKTSNSSLGSNNSASNKTIFNRTMKKVRSLIKK